MRTSHRKKPRSPQKISDQTWEQVRLAVCAGGLGWKECADRFGISDAAIKMKARRHGWLVLPKVAKTAEALRKSVTERAVCAANRNSNKQLAEIISESWAQKGEQHRALAFQIATDALRALQKSGGLVIADPRGFDLTDRVARRNAGLDGVYGHGLNPSSGIQIICQRIENQLNLTASQSTSAQSDE
jgi:hypothetical protein